MSKLFPLGLALGKAFCNRVSERAMLADNIADCRHTILLSPRRYGKTSLANQVFLEGDILYVKFDFLLISDERTLRNEILSGISKIVAKLLPLPQRGYEILKKFLGFLKPEIILSGEGGAKVRFASDPAVKTPVSITEALEKLDQIAASENKTIVLFMDEFQQIATINDHEVFEAAFRHAAERAKNTCYIFSGSNRHLLLEMFQDSARPLYHLCEEMLIDRISSEDYSRFIQRAAKRKWGKELSEKTMVAILNFTKRHTYYVNLLCLRLWRKNILPTAQTVSQIWFDYCEEQRRRVSFELAKLSPNQRAVIRELAKHPTTTPTGRDLQASLNMPNASMVQALDKLQEKDLVYKDEDGVMRPLDPVVETLYG